MGEAYFKKGKKCPHREFQACVRDYVWDCIEPKMVWEADTAKITQHLHGEYPTIVNANGNIMQ